MMREILTLGVTVVLGALLYWQLQRAKKQATALPAQLFSSVKVLLEEGKIENGSAVGTWVLTGKYRDHDFQLKAIVDTLAARKLPSLWLMVTLPSTQNVKASLDLMMRPSGPTSFSNFDFLPETLPTPSGFPLHAVIRSDNAALCPDPEILRNQLALFNSRFGKELLISPQGLRIVGQVAEVDRLRYGVFREANFGDTIIDADLAIKSMNTLIDLQAELKKNNG